jgi:hypothetical protein
VQLGREMRKERTTPFMLAYKVTEGQSFLTDLASAGAPGWGGPPLYCGRYASLNSATRAAAEDSSSTRYRPTSSKRATEPFCGSPLRSA